MTISKRQKQIGAGLAVFVALLFGVTAARAQSGFWDVVAKVAGQVLGDRLADQVTIDEFSGDDFAGGAGDTFTNRRTAQKQLITDSPVTTTAFVVVNSSVTTTIKEIVYYPVLSASTIATGTFSFGIAAAADCVAGNATLATTFAMGVFATTTNQYFATSTFSTASQRVVSPGHCVKAVHSAPVTTTAGFLAVDNFIQQ